MKLLLMNDPALRQVCEPVKPEELDHIKSLVPEMTKILNDEAGAALAANQVGITKRFFLLKQGEEVRLVINPVIISMGDLKPFEEGCLSIPGTTAKTKRAQEATLRFTDDNWVEQELALTGIEAVAIQHEIDHLDGKLYTDKLPPMERIFVLDKHRKFLKAKGRMR